MAIYRETFKLKNGCFSLSDFLSKIEKHTGLNFDMEVIDASSAFISCKKFKNVSIEINIENDEKVNVYFPPKKKIFGVLHNKHLE
ncbi:hypothetical protein [Microbulbifer thermotolerans]|uniref:hypothetical protein n=1 Tax=Microbulbifer thermotolerans TaxID=252514 RepID=UPI00224A7142|nr:hypothetical protein [Microbulbifer thermotolerans]